MKRADCITYDAQVKSSRAILYPSVSVAKTGLIKLNQLCADLLQLKHGDGVMFNQSKKDKTVWSIEKAINGQGIIIRKDKTKKSLEFNLNCSVIAKTLLQSIGGGNSVRLKVGSEPEDNMYELITAAVLKH